MTEETTGTAQPEQPESKPALRIITSSTTPEEVAAIVAVLASLGGGEEPAPKRPRSLWATPNLRGIAHSGPGAWRASGLSR